MRLTEGVLIFEGYLFSVQNFEYPRGYFFRGVLSLGGILIFPIIRYPITAAEPEDDMEIIILLKSCMGQTYVYKKILSSDAEHNPDKYILPLNVIKRPMGLPGKKHYAIYLGDKQVVHLPGEGKPTKIDT